MYTVFIIVWPILCGILIPILIGKGITINIVHKSVDTVDKPVKYNESLVDMLPNEVKQYYHSTNGQNRF